MDATFNFEGDTLDSEYLGVKRIKFKIKSLLMTHQNKDSLNLHNTLDTG
jgi:hypothetical protein